ncbi:MAG: hypothetical protein RHS_0274 [Robinsoniella sp. RHS]|nr:MAG: hypothetical protein RHS_0274 [Robinsoniella sp. RHS]
MKVEMLGYIGNNLCSRLKEDNFWKMELQRKAELLACYFLRRLPLVIREKL